MNLNTRLRHFFIQLKNQPNIIPRVSYCQKDTQITEEFIFNKLRQKFPKASISVEDTSGGCGAMFNVAIETEEFKGLSIMKQHRLVYDLLSEQLKAIHGLHLQTKAPN